MAVTLPESSHQAPANTAPNHPERGGHARGTDGRCPAGQAIAPGKDADGVTMHSFAAMGFGLPGFASATPGAIMRLLAAYDVSVSGRHAVVVGRSPILGKPAGLLLLAADATVTYCHSRTRGLPAIVATADIVVAAVGNAPLNPLRASFTERLRPPTAVKPHPAHPAAAPPGTGSRRSPR